MHKVKFVAATAILAALALMKPGAAAGQESEYVGSIPGDTAAGALLWVVVTRVGVGITVWDPPSGQCDALPPLLKTMPTDARGGLIASTIVCQTGASFAMTAAEARMLADSVEALAAASLVGSSRPGGIEVMLGDSDGPRYLVRYERSPDGSTGPAHRFRFGPRKGTSREFSLVPEDRAPVFRLVELLRDAARIHDTRPPSQTAH